MLVKILVYLYLYIYIYISISIYLYLSTYLPIYLSTYLPIYLSTYLSIYLSIYTAQYLYIYIQRIKFRLLFRWCLIENVQVLSNMNFDYVTFLVLLQAIYVQRKQKRIWFFIINFSGYRSKTPSHHKDDAQKKSYSWKKNIVHKNQTAESSNFLL